ncbi:uncharacterized protein LOC106086827 [Stomoxys calcitrans]|uniref:Uncharacterized protein n=1 Tax=Stomoxys calcitrans TaxID=35570 RepID=A0A1I8P329_STOCA|nr:uncharacterized protein LOC106086827 [Stomoxys calcitrans]
MTDYPENLNIHMIKRETSPSTSEERAPHDIKARLNLHVKRRLQDGHSLPEESVAAIHSPVSHKLNKDVPVKEARQKRPYNKRTDKSTKVHPTLSEASTSASIAQRKNKQKLKQVVTDSQDDTTMHALNINSGTVSAGDEDEGHDNDFRPGGREKEKCPDVLAMVLSMKKRALMQDPEVQRFLADVMGVIKT